MNFKYFDIHSHFNLPEFDADMEGVIKRMNNDGVGTICVGTGIDTSIKAVEISEINSNIWATVGLHPTDHSNENFNFEEYLKLAKNPRVVAIGECGLDYYRTLKEKVYENQKKIFIEHVRLAKEVGKPLMIHARPTKGDMDAYVDVLDILEEEKYTGKVNFHFFVGDIHIAKRIILNGWSMSFDGPITFSHDYDEVIKMIPLENIMAETDSPYAAPVPYRGQRAEPWMVEEVYKRIAEIKGLSLEEVTTQILKNVENTFGVS
jgi:TatD DNase family protein